MFCQKAAPYLVALTLAGCASLRADFVTIAQPTPSYVASTTLLDFTDVDYTPIGYLAGGGETLRYDSLLEVHSVPGTWEYWNKPPAVESSTPKVGWTGAFADNPAELTISLSHPASTFGVEIGPDLHVAEETTVDFYSFSTVVGTIDLFPSGDNGALLFAATDTANPFTRIVINNLDGDDFAIARQRFTLSPIPEPGTFALLGIPLAALFLPRRSRL